MHGEVRGAAIARAGADYTSDTDEATVRSPRGAQADDVRSHASLPWARFEVKLLLMNFLSRLIGHHKLLVLNFYSFVQRYAHIPPQPCIILHHLLPPLT